MVPIPFHEQVEFFPGGGCLKGVNQYLEGETVLRKDLEDILFKADQACGEDGDYQQYGKGNDDPSWSLENRLKYDIHSSFP